MGRSSRIVLLLFCAFHAHAQTSSHRVAAPSPAGSADAIGIDSLKVEGLHYARELDRIYWGDFDHLHMQRNGFEFALMMSVYMKDFGVICKNSLPKNKVEIIGQRCVESSYKYNQYGEIPGTRRCTEYGPDPTGVYADPVLYQAAQSESDRTSSNFMSQGLAPMLQGGDAGTSAALGNLMQTMDVERQAGEFKSDLEKMLQSNTCGGAALKRFEKNLIAFANGEPPIRMAGIPSSQGPFRDSDYQTLLDDLVSDQSKGWMFNRFVSNSISNVRVSLRDDAGRPLYIAANYAFTGSKGRAEGTVKLTFTDGTPHCLTFSDMPDTCRAVDHGIAAAYEDGKYVTDRPAETRTYVAPDLRQVEVVVDRSQPVRVEVPQTAFDMQQGIVYPIKGKLSEDLHAMGPGGGSVVLVQAGSLVNLSVFNSQNGTDFYLSHVGNDKNQGIFFNTAPTKLHLAQHSSSRDGGPILLEFRVSGDIKQKMLLTEYNKQQTVTGASTTTPPGYTSPASSRVSVGSDGSSPASVAAGSNKILPAGTLLQLKVVDSITVGQVAAQSLYPATVVTARTPTVVGAAGATLSAGTIVYIKISQASGGQYFIQADHAVVGGVSVPLTTNMLPRVPARTPTRIAPIQIGAWGNVRLPTPAQTPASMVLVAPGTLVQLSTKSDAILEGSLQ